jgi:type VI secretion system protein ImpA
MAELELFLSPIRVGAPTGEDLRLSAGDLTFQRIGEHRSEVDPQLDPSGTGRTADWNAVVRECEVALQQKTKDLQIAAWLTEGWARRDGFTGLRDGLTLVRSLCETFWEGLHPGVDGGVIDPAVRARPLSWLGSSRDLLRSIKACPILREEGAPPLSWEHYELSQIVDQQSLGTDQTRYDEMIANGWIGGEEWRLRLRGTRLEKLQQIHATVGECEVALEELRKLASQRFEAADAPNLIPLGNLLNEIREHLASYLKTHAAPSTAARTASAPVSAASSETALASGPIRSREQALRILTEVAEYYRKNEPHSPIAALVMRAARWGEMPFEQVLREVVQDEGVLTRAFDMLGIRSEPEGAGS